jgi:hypothetical protein
MRAPFIPSLRRRFCGVSVGGKISWHAINWRAGVVAKFHREAKIAKRIRRGICFVRFWPGERQRDFVPLLEFTGNFGGPERNGKHERADKNCNC